MSTREVVRKVLDTKGLNQAHLGNLHKMEPEMAMRTLTALLFDYSAPVGMEGILGRVHGKLTSHKGVRDREDRVEAVTRLLLRAIMAQVRGLVSGVEPRPFEHKDKVRDLTREEIAAQVITVEFQEHLRASIQTVSTSPELERELFDMAYGLGYLNADDR